MAKKSDIKIRVVDHTVEDPEQLLANPWNFRRHGAAQRAALNGSLKTLGWIRSVLVNRTTQHVLDGHMRIEEALKAKAKVPVEWCELTEAEEKLALATLDPMTAMADEDEEKLKDLLENVEVEDQALNDMLSEMAGEEKAGKVEVKEVDVTEVHDRFWLSARGPLPQQMAVLEKLRAALEELPGVEVEVGVSHG